MALSTTNATQRARQLAEDILRQYDDRGAQVQTLAEIRARVEQYELTFDVSSADARAAIRDGRLAETHDVNCWLMDYDALLRAGRT